MPPANRLKSESKTLALSNQLRNVAYQLGPGAKLPTAVELVRLFSTSRATLNDALDILESQHVLYRRRGSGIYVSQQLHTKSLCVLLYADLFLGPNKSPFWGMLSGLIAQEVERRTSSKAYHIEFHFLLQSVKEGAIALPERIQEMILSGLIHGILTVGMNHSTLTWLHQHGVPCVVYAGFGPYMVLFDTNALFQNAVAILSDLGCKRLGLWVETGYFDSEEDFRNAQSDEFARLHEHLFHHHLQTHNLPFYPELIRHNMILCSALSDPPQTFQQQGYRYVMEIFGQEGTERPDGIFIDNDMITVGAMIAFQQLGIRVGEDVQVVSQANIDSPMLFGYEHQIHVVEFHPVDLVQAMFAMLESLLASEQLPPSLRVEIPPRLSR